MSDKMINILSFDEEEEDLGGPSNFILRWNSVNTEILTNNFKEFAENAKSLIAELPQFHQDFQVDTIELNLSVTTSGEVGLSGTGFGGEQTGGIKLILKRNTPEK
jgi:hypothetical protein